MFCGAGACEELARSDAHGCRAHRLRSPFPLDSFCRIRANYYYADLFEIFEKILPAEFGGALGDYQLVEEENSGGQTMLTLLVHPQIGELNEKKLLERVEAAFAQGPWGNQLMARIWHEAGSFRIRRAVPHASPRGKILPLHMPTLA
jgi:hypothetical protein